MEHHQSSLKWLAYEFLEDEVRFQAFFLGAIGHLLLARRNDTDSVQTHKCPPVEFQYKH